MTIHPDNENESLKDKIFTKKNIKKYIIKKIVVFLRLENFNQTKK